MNFSILLQGRRLYILGDQNKTKGLFSENKKGSKVFLTSNPPSDNCLPKVPTLPSKRTFADIR